jgi:hypothetical protein
VRLEVRLQEQVTSGIWGSRHRRSPRHRAARGREIAHRRGPAEKGGMLDPADERNPFADYSVVHVPYCTGDTHIGATTTKYAPGLIVHHKGYVNGTAALDRLAAAVPRANEVVVAGESAAPWRRRCTADSSRTASPTPGSRCSRTGRAPTPTCPAPTRSSRPGAPTTPCRPRPRTPAGRPSGGASRGCSSGADGTTGRSCSPATTTPTTRSRRAGTHAHASR